MTCPSDQLLATRVRQGDERAFVTLVRRYERVLARLIGQYIGTGDDRVQDVLQETMASAWSALRKDTPRDVRAWIMQVARNRCRDYFRSTQRRELFVEDKTLELMVNRRGLGPGPAGGATAAEVVEAMEEVTPQETGCPARVLRRRPEHCGNSCSAPETERHDQAPSVSRARPGSRLAGRHP